MLSLRRGVAVFVRVLLGVYIIQSPQNGLLLCGFNLLLWPLNFRSKPSLDNVDNMLGRISF